jgi:peptide/nickel transport system substrate-binding protein
MFGSKTRRLVGLALVLVMSLTLMVGVARAQDVTFIIGWEQEPDLPSPLSSSAFSSYLANFYARDVWGWDSSRTIFPVMVEEIPTVENGLVTFKEVTLEDGTTAEAPVVTYKLRAGMLWSDGTPITADDCMFYHNLMTQPDPVDSWQRGLYPDVIASATKVDDLTVVLEYNNSFPDFLTDTSLSCGFPAHKFLGENGAGFTMDTDGDGVFDANADEAPYFQGFDPAELVGYGPYVLSEFNVGSNAVWTLNPNWGANDWETVPAITTLITQFILESQQMENAMQVGDIDMAFNFDGVNNGYREMADVGVFNMDGVFVDGIWMNAGPGASPAMQDVRVREAIVHAIDRRGIADQFSGEGAGELLTLAWAPTAFTPPDLGFREFDLDGARALLTEAGWVDDDGDEGTADRPTLRVSQGVTLPDGTAVPDGEPLILRFYTTPVVPRPDIQVVIQSQLAQVGIRAQTFVVNGPTVLFASFAERGVLNNGEYDLAMYALSNNPLSPNGSSDNFHCDGIPSTENPAGRNSIWFCSEEYDRLDDLVAITNDPEERLALAYEREPYFFDAAVWHSIRPRPTWYAVRTDRWDIETFREMGTLTSNYFQNVEDWRPVS